MCTTCTIVFIAQRVQIIRFSVRVMGCVFLRVNCVMATRSVAIKVMRPPAFPAIVVGFCCDIYMKPCVFI